MAGESRTRLVAAFAALYIVWGSTYLAIRVAIETMPPFAMAGTRFLAAGLMLYLWARRSGVPHPSARQWRSAAIIGGLMLLGGNGGVVWAEQRVSSGLTALMVGAGPLWMILLDWLRPGGRRPLLGEWIGLLVGFAGVALLAAPTHLGGGAMDLAGSLVLIFATVTWSLGSIYSRHAETPRSPLMAIAANMLAGGVGLTLAALLHGEVASLQPAAFSLRSLLAWGYLVIFGSVVGFSSYIWLLRHTTLAKASTYAYVNPVIAVFMGWLILDEPITIRTGVSAVLVIFSVVVISGLPYLRQWRQEQGVERKLAA